MFDSLLYQFSWLSAHQHVAKSGAPQKTYEDPHKSTTNRLGGNMIAFVLNVAWLHIWRQTLRFFSKRIIDTQNIKYYLPVTFVTKETVETLYNSPSYVWFIALSIFMIVGSPTCCIKWRTPKYTKTHANRQTICKRQLKPILAYFKNVYTYTNTYTHIYIYISAYINWSRFLKILGYP